MAKERTVITAHRGMGPSSKKREEISYAENSIAAFKEAIRVGADALECDIHVSRDYHAMVIHGSKMYHYGDYIGEANPELHLGGSEKLQVERLTCQELQEGVALKDYNPDRDNWEFDGLTKEEKKAVIADAGQRETVVAQKRALLAINPEAYRIPALTELLQLTFACNQQRVRDRVPLLKLNIELKGENAAIASFKAIKEFYDSHSPVEVKLYLPPEHIIFLGRHAGKEIVIANTLLKEAPYEAHAVRGELEDQFKKDFVLEEAERKRWEAQIDNATSAYSTIESVFDGKVLDQGLEELKPQMLVLSYSAAGGTLEELSEAIYSPSFLRLLEASGKSENFHEHLHSLIQEGASDAEQAKRKIKKECKKAAKLITLLGKELHLHTEVRAVSTTVDLMKLIHNKAAEEAWRSKRDDVSAVIEHQLSTQFQGSFQDQVDILAQIMTSLDATAALQQGLVSAINARLGSELSIEDFKCGGEGIKASLSGLSVDRSKDRVELVLKEACQTLQDKGPLATYKQRLGTSLEQSVGYIKRHIRGAKTNLMLTTGQLFGPDALSNQEDFDTFPHITEISLAGERRIREALAPDYGYNGIDVSLYDSTPKLVEIIREAEQESADRVILGMTASNWRGTRGENSLTTPGFAIMRSEAIASASDVPVLLKVDEPGKMKSLLEKVRALDGSGHSLGRRTVMKRTTVTVTSALTTDRAEAFEAADSLLSKISSKPPRDMVKNPAWLTAEHREEVARVIDPIRSQLAFVDEAPRSPISQVERVQESRNSASSEKLGNLSSM